MVVQLDAQVTTRDERRSGEVTRLGLHDGKRFGGEYRQYQEFYKGRHFERARNGRSNLVLNYARAVVDKGVAYLLGRGVGFGVVREAGDQRARPSAGGRGGATAVRRGLGQRRGGGGLAGCPERGGAGRRRLQGAVGAGSGRIRMLSVDPRTFFATWAGDDASTLRRVEVVYSLGAEDLALGGYGLTGSEAEALCGSRRHGRGGGALDAVRA